MPIRHAMSFRPSRPQPVVFNKTYVVQQQTHCHRSGNGAFWGGFLGGILSGVGNFFVSNKTNLGGNNPYGYLNQLNNTPAKPDDTMNNLKTLYSDYTWIKEGDKYIGRKGDSEVEGRTLDEVRANMKAPAAPEAAKTAEPKNEGLGGLEPAKVQNNYGIDKENGNTTFEIDQKYTWYGIVSAKYDIPEGVNPKEVAYALAAANSGASGAEAMQIAKEGVHFGIGDIIDLPDTLEVGGKTISLKEGHENIAVTPQDYNTVASKHWTAKIQQVGDQYYVTKNGVRIGESYKTESEAQKAIDKMKADENSL